jgi:hypothetical protein
MRLTWSVIEIAQVATFAYFSHVIFSLYVKMRANMPTERLLEAVAEMAQGLNAQGAQQMSTPEFSGQGRRIHSPQDSPREHHFPGKGITLE